MPYSAPDGCEACCQEFPHCSCKPSDYIKQKRNEIRAKMMELASEFTQETGITINSVHFEYSQTVGGDSNRQIRNANVEINI